MKVLVTGASGFLGQAVVAAFLRRGHQVRAMVRPSARAEELPWGHSVEFFRADLRVDSRLVDAFDGIDALVHLAACVIGDDATHFTSTIGGTERLLQAMAQSATRRIILASSFSVYGWREARRTLDESTPLAKDMYKCGAYAIAKIWQERVARRISQTNGWDLTVMRPGVIWGPGHELVTLVGPAFGPLQLVIGIGKQLPLTYVENCADCFVKATEAPAAAGETFNIVDEEGVTAWRYAAEYLRWRKSPKVRIPVPYSAGMLTAMFVAACSRWLFKGGGKVPSLFMPSRFALYRPLRFNCRKLKERLGWEPPRSYQQALECVFRSQQQVAVTNTPRQQNAQGNQIPGEIEENAQKTYRTS